MEYRANRFDAVVPDAWRDDTVHRFTSPDGEECITIRIEHRAADIPLDDRLREKTATVREGVLGARLVSSGEARLGGGEARRFVVEGLRGDEVVMIYAAFLARWGERRLLMLEYEGPATRWGQAELQLQRTADSLRRRDV